MNAMQNQPRTKAKCPICARPAEKQVRPFCSRRCADVDLNRWLSGTYVVSGREDEDEDGARVERMPDDRRG
jgi:endogenous inhibitor of DNA gyrase (YacG/DUF329 family)